MSSEKEKNNVPIEIKEVKQTKYELLPPEGGWGHIVTLALVTSFIVTVVPMAAFGLIYTNFLNKLGDSTKGTTMANGIFNTCLNFTGLITNLLLKKYSYRKVALFGAVLYNIGAFSIPFSTNLIQFIISFGVIQGIGFGLCLPSLFAALKCYFDKKLNLMNSIAQAIIVAATIVTPIIINYLKEEFGFKGTVFILAAISLNLIFAASVLQPVKWHLIKKPIDSLELSTIVNKYNVEHKDHQQINPLLHKVIEKDIMYISPKPRASIISLGDRALSVTTITADSKYNILKNIARVMDLALFKDPVYLNISLGMSLSFTADIAFISILPLILSNSGFNETQVAFMMTLHFASDLVARIAYSVISAIYVIRNRYVLLGGSILSAVFRIAYVFRDDYYYKLICLGALGFLRCFIQTPLPVIMADEYQERFVSAFSLYMVVCGVISLIFGPLMSFVKSYTQSDTMVVHLLTGAYLWCSVTWLLELIYRKLINKERKR